MLHQTLFILAAVLFIASALLFVTSDPKMRKVKEDRAFAAFPLILGIILLVIGLFARDAHQNHVESVRESNRQSEVQHFLEAQGYEVPLTPYSVRASSQGGYEVSVIRVPFKDRTPDPQDFCKWTVHVSFVNGKPQLTGERRLPQQPHQICHTLPAR